MAYFGGTSVPGYDQDKNKKVNQDGFFVLKKNQSFCLIVCDGAGSAKFSHIGSKAFSKNLAKYFLNSYDQFSYENMDRLIYEGKLTKQGDFGGSSNGIGCNQDYLFNDGVRRSVYLRVGYELNSNFIDRILQVRNPEGNPQFDGPHGFIGGFIITEWPNAHPLKEFNQIMINERDVNVNWNDEIINLEKGEWNLLPDEIPTHDVVLSWAGQPVTLSTFVDEFNSTTITLTNTHLDDEDSGFCLCIVHGGIEIGGGLIHYPVESGELSAEAIRRLTINPTF